MKFSKDFKRQMVPEWIEAYVDYAGLKRILREILHYNLSKKRETPLKSLEKKLSLHRTLSGLHRHTNGDVENQVTREGREIEIEFFRKLDEELNKINTFYKEQIEVVMDESTLLNKQLHALIALRLKVRSSCSNGACSPEHQGVEMGSLDSSSEVEMSEHRALEVSSNSLSGSEITDVILQGINQDDESTSVSENNTIEKSNGRPEEVGNNSTNQQGDPLEILERVKIRNTLESPLDTIKGVFKDSKHDDLCFKKDELKKVEAKLRLAFIEFYQKLRLVKQYSFMNLSALSKIMKSYEKITSRREARLYIQKIDNSYIGSSDEVNNLLERVEATFIKHFSNSNIQKGMKSLRPKTKTEKHSVTFWSGCFSGFSAALLIAVALRIETKKLMEEEGASYTVNIFPLHSIFAYIVLHLLIYAADIYFWRRFKINYPFIFGFKPGTELSYREVFLLGTDLGSTTQRYKTLTGLFPLGLVAVRFYKYLSYFFLFRCLCAPLYKVTLPDFFLADHVTSQVTAIRSLDLYICYYGLGERSQRESKCHGHGIYNVLYLAVPVIPFWLRFLQCIRRLFEEKEAMHGYSSVNYLLTIVAAIIRTICELKKGMAWMVLALVSSSVAVIVATYWDIVFDWGLLRRHSKNPYLRDKLLVPYKSVYFAAMALDVVLRIAWMQLVLEFKLHSLHRMAITTVVSCLEIIRRGIWSFFRIENEHLNNLGKYRAFKSVPLPFNYDEEEESSKDD
ncbi:hypothetical protein E1A91_A13G086800v1 [Gossypium mustelinum]|uniref:SPX domain-containing protein n=1 Tax=Gossypium mustelinum TaxID=34275 RepID=A0A5D2WFJ0_GOSMU|nr:hypothetical protein E1A91_A13G086800v1 [Gossypium mustelinum]